MLFETTLPPKITTLEQPPLARSASPASASSSSSASGKRFSLLTKLLKENEAEGANLSSLECDPAQTNCSNSSKSNEGQRKKRSSTLDYSCEDLLHAISRELSSRAEQQGTAPLSSNSLSLFGSEDDGSIMDDLPEFSQESALFESGLRRFAVCDKSTGDYLYNVCVDFAQHTLCLRDGSSSPIRVGGSLQKPGLGLGLVLPSLPTSENPPKYSRSPLQPKRSPREAIFVEVSARRVSSPRGLWKVVDSVAMEQKGKEDLVNSCSPVDSPDGSDGGAFYCVSSSEDLVSMANRSEDSLDSRSPPTFELSV